MEEFKAGNDLVSLSLSGGLVVLFLYFLLCAALQRRGAFLLLAVCCLMMALRDQNFLVIHALPPDTSWYLAYRLFMAVTALLPGMVLLLLGSMYPTTVKRLPTLLHAAAMVVARSAHGRFAYVLAGDGVYRGLELRAALSGLPHLERARIIYGRGPSRPPTP